MAWLNDRTINKAFEIYSKKVPEAHMLGYPYSPEKKIDALLVSTFYFESLRCNKMEQISEWQKHISMEKISKILVPLFANSHWSLAVIYPSLRACIIFDSLRPHHKELYLPLLEHPLVDMVVYSEQCSQQNNSDDCGIFLIYYAGCILKKSPEKIFKSIPSKVIETLRKFHIKQNKRNN
ncbi:hypothetical protein NEFER03_2045 [Nematocida sp. LUAm3]|nr:hypothetical protein NEFER03_2045 [Nematocida sp. LUAm3]KAI5176494.1 hypothetical protein NEFER02_2235 [Nematocida sp. LUAm2]KAI5179170.1 hypothetical protein NEFER01_2033 [Nematocida sp. LUAm1]